MSTQRAKRAPPSPEDTWALSKNGLNDIILTEKSQHLRELKSFLNQEPGTKYLRNKGSTDTNIFVQGGGMYAFPHREILKLFSLLEAVRREGVVSHYSERQGTPASPDCGIMLDYDLCTNNPEVCLTDKHVYRIANCVVSCLVEDLVFPQEALLGKSKEINVKVFSIVKPAPLIMNNALPQNNTKPQYKYGFHILIPQIWVGRDYKRYLIKKLANQSS